MTPKLKAQELVDKMQLDWACDSCHNDWAKECALIAVDYINLFWNGNETALNYWNEVKQEIEKL